jgi:hypothetical protein
MLGCNAGTCEPARSWSSRCIYRCVVEMLEWPRSGRAYSIPFSRQILVGHSWRARCRTKSVGNPDMSRRREYVRLRFGTVDAYPAGDKKNRRRLECFNARAVCAKIESTCKIIDYHKIEISCVTKWSRYAIIVIGAPQLFRAWPPLGREVGVLLSPNHRHQKTEGWEGAACVQTQFVGIFDECSASSSDLGGFLEGAAVAGWASSRDAFGHLRRIAAEIAKMYGTARERRKEKVERRRNLRHDTVGWKPTPRRRIENLPHGCGRRAILLSSLRGQTPHKMPP